MGGARTPHQKFFSLFDLKMELTVETRAHTGYIYD